MAYLYEALLHLLEESPLLCFRVDVLYIVSIYMDMLHLHLNGGC